MKNIKQTAEAVLQMDTYLRGKIAETDDPKAQAMLWKNTYIKKQIDKREQGGIFTVSDHIRAMVYSMLTSGASWVRVLDNTDIATGQIPIVDEIFYQYNADTLLKTDPNKLKNDLLSQTLGTQYIENQMNALVNVNIGKLIAYDTEYGSIDNFYKQFIDTDSTAKTLVKVLSAEGKPHKFAQLREALVAEYLRNVGYDIAKPDRHIRRILGSDILGCSDKQEVPIYEAFDIVKAIADELGKRTAEVDYILWSYCANGYGAVCTKDKPKCDNCIVNQCFYRNNKI